MKKALSVFLMIAVAFGAFAAEPAAGVSVAEFKGEASVTFGVDLDSGKTGFENSASAHLKLNLLKGGEKSTTGEGIWGEIVIKTTDLNLFDKIGEGSLSEKNHTGDNMNFDPNNGANGFEEGEYDDDNDKVRQLWRVTLEKAQINFGPAYVGIKSGDTQTGELKLVTPILSSSKINGAISLPNVGPKDYDQGIVLGFDNDLLKLEGDIRSKPEKVGDKTNYFTNDYAMAFETEIKAIENLSVKGGVSFQFNSPNTLGYSGSVGYKLGLNDTFSLYPQVGIAGQKDGDPMLAGGLILQWGEEKDDNAGVYFLDAKKWKKVTPGVGLTVRVPLTEKPQITLIPSFYSGELIPGLTAAANLAVLIPTVEGGKAKMTLDAGAKYAIPVDAVTITPQAGVHFANTTNDELKVKLGADITGLVSNTTFTAVWESGSLLADPVAPGTLKFTTKIAF